MKVTPYGMKNSVEHEISFNPRKPVKICFWGIDRVGFVMGFSQMVARGKFFGGLFWPHIRPIEWKGGNIEFGSQTEKKFAACFQKVYGVTPTCEPANWPKHM